MGSEQKAVPNFNLDEQEQRTTGGGTTVVMYHKRQSTRVDPRGNVPKARKIRSLKNGTNVMNVMKNIIDNRNWPGARFVLKLLSFTCLTSMIVVVYREFGFSAVLLLLSMIDFLLLTSLSNNFGISKDEYKLY